MNLADWSPAELGLPEKFEEFRPAQVEAVEWALESPARYIGMCLPTGSGKTLVAMAMAKASGKRTAILTSTKGLMEQYMGDFGQGGLMEIKGKGNYRCGDKPTNCRMGPHEGCRSAGGLGCNYEAHRYEAKCSNLLGTNYAYWIKVNERARGLEFTKEEDGLNPFELLVLDEGHRTVEELSRSLRVSIREVHLREAHIEYDPKCEDVGELAEWADDARLKVKWQLEAAIGALRKKPTQAARDRVYVLEELMNGLEAVAGMQPEYWVVEQRPGTEWGRVWDWDCVWPGNWAESRLFMGIPKIVLMSATLRPMTMRMLGMQKEDSEFREWPRVFPANHTPVYHVPTVRMNWRNEQDRELMEQWVRRIDEIIESRLDRKGLVHTVSYARQQYLLAHSHFARHFVVNSSCDSESATAAEVVDKFKQMEPPAILVSPSFSTGWDFPARTCEWQIIAKVPIPPATSKVMKARRERSPQYIDYLAMQDLVQACGRGTRSESDRCEIFIVDDTIKWFLWRNKKLAPGWFSVTETSEVPAPGKRGPQ